MIIVIEIITIIILLTPPSFLFILVMSPLYIYTQTANIRRMLVGDNIFDHSDVVGASPVGAAPTASSLST